MTKEELEKRRATSKGVDWSRIKTGITREKDRIFFVCTSYHLQKKPLKDIIPAGFAPKNGNETKVRKLWKEIAFCWYYITELKEL